MSDERRSGTSRLQYKDHCSKCGGMRFWQMEHICPSITTSPDKQRIAELEQRVGELSEENRALKPLEDFLTITKLEERVDTLEKELAQRKGWQKCETHGEINADHAWGCPDCVDELRRENRKLVLDNLSMSEKLQGTYDVPEGGAK